MSHAPADHDAPSSAPDLRWGLWLLVAGALLGAAIAGREVIGMRESVPSGVAALVDGVPIALVELEQAIAAASDDRGTPLTKQQQRAVLHRLIDEELLFARALALDLPRHDTRLHAEIVSTFVSQVVAPAEGAEPTDAELAQLLSTERARFTAEPLVRLDALFLADGTDPSRPTAERRAQLASARLRGGEPVTSITDADRFALPVPTSLSSRETWTAVLGPTATRAALTLSQGAVSEPIRTVDGYVVLRVLERRAMAPQLSDVRALVRDAWIRKRGEDELRATIDDLRSRADVRVAD